MLKTFLFGVAVAASTIAVGNAVQAGTQKGRCTVTASVHGGKKFAVLKCDRASHPGDFIIRSMVWEKEDRAGYNRLARFSGRRFTCDITFDHMSRGGGYEWTNYKLGKCR
jgi:hypothetical protein